MGVGLDILEVPVPNRLSRKGVYPVLLIYLNLDLIIKSVEYQDTRVLVGQAKERVDQNLNSGGGKVGEWERA